MEKLYNKLYENRVIYSLSIIFIIDCVFLLPWEFSVRHFFYNTLSTLVYLAFGFNFSQSNLPIILVAVKLCYIVGFGVITNVYAMLSGVITVLLLLSVSYMSFDNIIEWYVKRKVKHVFSNQTGGALTTITEEANKIFSGLLTEPSGKSYKSYREVERTHKRNKRRRNIDLIDADK